MDKQVCAILTGDQRALIMIGLSTYGSAIIEQRPEAAKYGERLAKTRQDSDARKLSHIADLIEGLTGCLGDTDPDRRFRENMEVTSETLRIAAKNVAEDKNWSVEYKALWLAVLDSKE